MARGYRVRILDGEGDELWAKHGGERDVAVLARAGRAARGRTCWQVTAYLQGGGDADAVASVLASFDFQP